MGEPPCWRWLFPIEGRYMNAIIQKLSTEFITIDMNNEFILEYNRSWSKFAIHLKSMQACLPYEHKSNKE